MDEKAVDSKRNKKTVRITLPSISVYKCFGLRVTGYGLLVTGWEVLMTLTDKIKKVTYYIDTHRNQKLSIHKLAKEVHLSYHYLCKSFKKETGFTILQYIHKKRIEYACNLLRLSDYSVAEIAAKSGYKDVKKFYVRFKKIMKITPNIYKKMEKKLQQEGINDDF